MNASGADAASLITVCVPCPGSSLDSFAVVLCIFIALVGLLPLLVSLTLKAFGARSADDTEGGPPSASRSWPRRQRSLVSYVSFQLGWLMAIFGLTPSFLWSVGNYWTGDVASYYFLIPFGFLAMLLAVRPDDSICLIRSVSALFVVLLFTYSCMTINSVLEFRSSGATEFKELSYEAFGRLALATEVSIVTVGSAMALIPVHGYRLRWTNGAQSTAMSSESRLLRLWWVVRGTLVCLGLSFSCNVILTMVMSRWLAFSQSGSYLFAIFSLFVVYGLTTPHLRIRIHMGRLKLTRVDLHASHVSLQEVRASPPSLNPQDLPSTSSPSSGVSKLSARSTTSAPPRADPSGDLPYAARNLPSTRGIATPATWIAPWKNTWTGNLSIWERAEKSGLVDDMIVDNLLGEGTYGNVYRCYSASGKLFAVKVFNPAPYKSNSEMPWLLSEVKLAEELDHENLVRTFGKVLLAGHWPAIIMEYMLCSLHEYLHDRESWMPELTCAGQHRIAAMARGLAYMHSTLKIFHRDLKPKNVLLDGRCDMPKIADFGMATRFGMENSTVGTLRCEAKTGSFKPTAACKLL